METLENQTVEQPVVPEQPPEAPPVATGLPEGKVDETPDPETLKAEIARLEQVRKDAEEKAVYWRKQKAEARAEFFKGRGEETKPPEQDLGIGAAPNKDDFDDYDKYNEAKIAYEVNKAKITWDREQARKQADQSRQDKLASLQSRIEEGYKKYTDFEEVALDRSVPITPMIMEALADSERPEDVAYYLGKNRAEAIKLSRMTPMAAAREIGRIEAKLGEAGPGPSSNQLKIPGAPPPIKPVGSTHVVSKPLDKMTQAEFEAEMERRTGRRF